MKSQKGAIRIKDIAEKAKVSVGTVDRVLHNRGKVSEDVKEKINQIIKELEYEPNLIARTLGSNKTYHIAVLMPDPSEDDYWNDCRIGIERAFKELRGYGISIDFYFFNLHKVNTFLERANELTEMNPEGILIAPLFLRETLPFFNHWNTKEIPYVAINTKIEEDTSLCYIGQDSYQSGKVAARLLHYNKEIAATYVIVHIEEDIKNSAHLIKKEDGFRDYFKEINSTEKIITADLPDAKHITFFENLDYLFAENPDIKGLYVTTSKAFEIAKYLKKRGIKKIKLIGYDLLEKNIEFLEDGTIDFIINQNPGGQGYWGISTLTDKLVFKKDVKSLKLLPLDIIIKENLRYYKESEN